MKIVAILLSLICIVGSLPQFGLQPLVWFALVPLLIALDGHTLKKLVPGVIIVTSVIYGLFTVSPLFRITTVWWQNAFGENVDMLLHYALVSMLGLLVAMPFVFTFVIYTRLRTHHARDPFLFAFTWVILEIFFTHVFLRGTSWGSVGYALLDTIWLKHVAALLSVHGLTFLVVLTNAYIAELYLLVHLKGWRSAMLSVRSYLHRPQALGFVSLFFTIWVIAIGFGYYREHVVSDEKQTIEALLVVDESRLAPPFESRYREYRRKIMNGLSMYPATDIVVLPENAMPFFVVKENGGELSTQQSISMTERMVLYEDLLSMTRMYPDTAFFVGLHTESLIGKRHNSLAYFQDGILRQVRSKQVLVPFYEYSPRYTGLQPFEEITSGEWSSPFELLGQRILSLICSEIAIPRLFTQKSDLILAPANERMFISPSFKAVQTAMARMRSIEYGAYVVRVGIGADNIVINPNGKIIAAQGDSGVLHVEIPY